MAKTRTKPNGPSRARRGAGALWGGRFAADPHALMQRINASIEVDRRLYAQDIEASKAHCRMLVATRVIARKDGDAILAGLEAIRKEIAAGRFAFSVEREDIHMNIEARLAEMIGEAAGRLHTARSRNDQVATDLRLWVRDAIDRIDAELKAVQAALIKKAGAHAATAMPGFTHLQVAQPVTFGHHLLAYVEMFGRDRGRFQDARARLNESPLGAAALAGTSFPIDRRMTAKALGFAAPMANSLDAVSDRDFAIEFLAAVSLAAVHLSRLAEEIVLWTSAQFGFAQLSDKFTTGSSIMPQKRNPDAAELIRAKAGGAFGALQSLMVAIKGLPLAYGKDMQEDKAPVFAAADSLELCLAAMTGMVADLKVDAARMRAAALAGYSTATDLADWLVKEKGVAFRDAHRIVGRVVRLAEQMKLPLAELPAEALARIDKRLTNGARAALGLDASLKSRTSEGGTAPARVREAVAAARRRFL